MFVLMLFVAFSLGATAMHWLCRNDYAEGFRDGIEFAEEKSEKDKEGVE